VPGPCLASGRLDPRLAARVPDPTIADTKPPTEAFDVDVTYQSPLQKDARSEIPARDAHARQPHYRRRCRRARQESEPRQRARPEVRVAAHEPEDSVNRGAAKERLDARQRDSHSEREEQRPPHVG